MKVTVSQIKKVYIDGLRDDHGLDPITVFLEDLEPRKGKITIECYGKSWSSYWGAMGDRPIAQFFITCNNDYLIGNLAGTLCRMVVDEDNAARNTRRLIGEKMREGEIDKEKAVELLEVANALGGGVLYSSSMTEELDYGWQEELPKKINQDYTYLSRILDAVREALKEL